MRMSRFLFMTTWLLLLAGFSGTAQKTAIHDGPEATYRQALELFENAQYGNARQLFQQTMEQISDPGSLMMAQAMYHAGACAAELFQPDAELLLGAFITRFTDHAKQPMARFYMGNIKYRQRKYEEAAGWYAGLSARSLDPELSSELWFKKAYCDLSINNLQAARMGMLRLTDQSSMYYQPARYYYGHIAYLQKDYDAAMEAFQKLTHDPNFGPAVPYYITHILFLEERFDELLTYASPLLEEATPQRSPEISRMIGEAHFRAGDYTTAIPYLERYIQSGQRVTREDHYQAGYAYYRDGQFDKAVQHLEKAATTNDLLSQNAWFHLASAYVETDQKRFARNAFQQAYQLGFDSDIAQESLFNYAILSFELSYDPYNEAILSFQKFIAEYPDSDRAAEAYEYLANLFLTTRNYREALVSLEGIPINTPRLQMAYQRINYFRGVELFNNTRYQEAIFHFRESRNHPGDRSLTAASLFWEGESQYRLNQFQLAGITFDQFLKSPGANSLDIYNQAWYSLGYAHFKQEQYARAIEAFRSFLSHRNEDPRMRNDAQLRVADSYFINKNYQAALDYYDQAIRSGLVDTDYASFQRALTYGVMGRFETKIASLQEFLRNYPRSGFADDAQYELGNTWLVLNNDNQAMNSFQHVITHHPHSSYVKSAMLKKGLILFNRNEDNAALEAFKQVIRQYPGTAESQEALAGIRNIYVSMDRVDEYVAYSQNLGFADVSVAEQDSLSYYAAENRYMQGDCQNAIASFNNYLDKFPNGIFALNAHFYRSECLFRFDDFRRALEGYRQVIARPRSKFTENALSRASFISYKEGEYGQAYEYFRQLEEVGELRNNVVEARIGQMRSLEKLGRMEEARQAAKAVIETDKVAENTLQEAWLTHGKAALQLNQMDEAAGSFERVRAFPKNQMAAEAMYNLALIAFRKGDYEGSEKMIFDFVNDITAYDYWLAKTFLLLADNYMETGNAFQARHTLQSILDNYKGEEILEQARQRMQFLSDKEDLPEGEKGEETDPAESPDNAF
jgi:TolA-binding protein